MKSFLTAFASLCHALEAAAAIAAPVVATMNPVMGGLLNAAAFAAVGVEAAITTPGAGVQKAAVVSAQTRATIDVANAILQSQGRGSIPSNTADVIAQQVGVLVASLNAVQQAVQPASAVAAVA